MENKIRNAQTIGELFSLMKRMVQRYLGKEQAGLLVGLSDLGVSPEGFVGAFYSPGSNIIVLNKSALSNLMQTNRGMYNFYIFHLLLHEYVHAIGVYDEQMAQQLVLEISRQHFGDNHILTELAMGLERFLPNFIYPSSETLPALGSIEFVLGIDRENTGYIN